LPEDALHQLLDLDLAAWHTEIDDIGRYLEDFGGRTPPALRAESQRVKKALG
jgi:phosphoenolpyruvate carboxykinase (GTP)